ncbi:RNA polymerase sigma factor [Actinomadura opuntiae]|uniref:RNA polymerase sigma factor n=1 Tax=Actinomadura sp. OS1-43 TaxID=604315 RepID=UPI00255B2B83|nr:sigma-70 family RNA polymerase sigma factor [Actinomadura sp. OS1-43]MDL4817743.1 sigma-70 family RNA polymerase sigma factor [Actinomadura sp. OS1-43]
MSGWPTLDRADDERLARELAAGDPGALIQVMDRYAARLYDYCHALLRDQEPAASALHDALVAAYASVPVLREPERFRGWLYALARNECMRRLRDPDRPTERHEAPEAGDGFLDGEELTRRLEARRLVHGALAGLRGREREALDLMLRHGLDAADIGAVLGLDAQEATDLTGTALARLDDALAAAHVAHAGRDECPAVADLAGDGDWPLPPPTVRRLVHHIQDCPVCSERRRRNVSAARLLNVLPVAMMPTDLRGLVMATATDAALAADMAAIAHRAGPFDAWGWPEHPEQAAADAHRRGTPRALWPAVAAAIAVLLIVSGAFFLMPDGSSGNTGAQSAPSGSSSAPDPSESTTSLEPSTSPSPTTSSATPTPTPTRTSATPTPTHTRTKASHSSRPAPTHSKPTKGTLSVTGCSISAPGGSCAISVQAVGGSVTWSVTGTSSSLISAGGGGTLAAGGSTSVTVTLSGSCTSSDSGTVSFSPGAAASVSWTCAPPDGGNGSRHD